MPRSKSYNLTEEVDKILLPGNTMLTYESCLKFSAEVYNYDKLQICPFFKESRSGNATLPINIFSCNYCFQAKHIMAERNVLLQNITHPFLVVSLLSNFVINLHNRKHVHVPVRAHTASGVVL